MTTLEMTWPPPYTLRHSAKAKGVLLRVLPHKGLEVVLPIKRRILPPDEIRDTLNTHRRWIEKTLRRLAIQPISPLHSEIALPTVLECPAISKQWEILYIPKENAKTVTLKMIAPHLLRLQGNIQDKQLCKRALIKWLVKMAQEYLTPWIIELSQQTGLAINRVSIRGQTLIWGSCTSKKNISLNYKLLFLPNTLTRHVLLHELCHIRHLNHSDRFWNLLRKWDNECEKHKKLLNTPNNFIPHWL